MAVELEEARALLREVRDELLGKPNVVAVGVGHKTVAGREEPELALVCSVHTKKPLSTLSPRDIVPASIQNVPTDVNPTGVIATFQDHTGRHRPAPGGVSVGHYLITAGTLGCLVRKNGTLYILSNNHVLANVNSAVPGDAVLQPGPADGGRELEDVIAHLSEYVPIRFENEESTCSIARAAARVLNAIATVFGSSTRLVPVRVAAPENLVDCAIAEPTGEDVVANTILGLGPITGVDEGTLGMEVAKSGRTSGVTRGVITQIDVAARVSMGLNRVALFTDQLMTGPIGQPGDSGTALLSGQNKLVGLLFAGGETNTIFNRIQNVFNALSVQPA